MTLTRNDAKQQAIASKRQCKGVMERWVQRMHRGAVVAGWSHTLGSTHIVERAACCLSHNRWVTAQSEESSRRRQVRDRLDMENRARITR